MVQVLLRLRELQSLLGLPSVAAAAKVMIKQPNLLARKPDTLRWEGTTARTQLAAAEP